MVQIAKSMPDFTRELEGFQLGRGQPVFELLNAALGKGEAVNNPAYQQEKGRNQNPETNAKRRFSYSCEHTACRQTIPRPALRLKTAQVLCREGSRMVGVAAP